MLTTIEQTLGKTCVIGLSYFDHQELLIKQSKLAGKVIAVHAENGITIELVTQAKPSETKGVTNKKSAEKAAHFIIPANLSCWFIAPTGEFHTNQEGAKMINPDFLVTWDIYQMKANKTEGEQQWWQWRPRTQAPQLSDSQNT